MRVDAHHHLWDLSVRPQGWISGAAMAPIARSHLLPEFEASARAQGIDASVLVQTVPVPQETPELLAIAAASDVVAAVTGWVDLPAPDAADAVARLQDDANAAHLRAVRAQVQAEADPSWLCREDVRLGLAAVARRGLLGEVVVLPHQLPAVERTAAAMPALELVLDHAGKPDLRRGDLREWERDIRSLARHPQVTCKLSGLVTEADWRAWDVTTLQPVADVVLDAFGPDRVMLGSDWPVCRLAGDHATVLRAYRELLAGCSAAERDAVEGGTAARVYRIS